MPICCSAIFGRGPTRLMSPRRTLMHCGSSSSLSQRRKRPKFVICPGAADATRAIGSESEWNMVRNLKIVNGFPNRPMRDCRKMTGPGEERRTAAAIKNRSGTSAGLNNSTRVTSKARFVDDADHALSWVSTSLSGSTPLGADAETRVLQAMASGGSIALQDSGVMRQPAGPVHFAFNPVIGTCHAIAESDRRRPAKALLNARVVAIATVYAPRRKQVVAPLEMNSGEAFNQGDELIDGDEFAGAEIQRLADIALGDQPGSYNAVIDVHEAPRLRAVAPYFDFAFAGELGLNDFATQRGRRLFPAARPGAEGAVNVVIAGHAAFEPEVFFEMA